MVKLHQAIVVEGRYDKNTLSQVVDAPILQTNGFGIMKDKALLALLRQVAKTRGLIVFTDSDGGGLVIRNYLKKTIPAEHLLHAYIPRIPGKERRKAAAGKEGILGVEGMTPQVILDCLRRAGATEEGQTVSPVGHISKQDLVELGLSGAANSRMLRENLLNKLGFPLNMSANAMLQALNMLYDRDALQDLMEKL